MWQALRRIAGALNDSGVLWCVGASLLLHQYGLAENPHDIDLLVALPDAEKAAGLLGGMGEALPCGGATTYSTEFFRRFRVDGCDVDLMAGFRLNHASGSYEYPLDGASVAFRREVGSGQAPSAIHFVSFSREDASAQMPFTSDPNRSFRAAEDTTIPFAALEDWYVVYQLIPGKEHKALRIEEYFQQNGIEHPRLLERALNGCLPDAVRQRISLILGK